MNLDTSAFYDFPTIFTTLDLHAGGEPVRLLIEGLPTIPGETMNQKRLYVGEHHDDVRLLLTREPRGHRDMFAAIVTEPVSADGDFGLVFMDPRRYPYMCGHGTIGAVTAAVEMGWVEVPDSGALDLEVPVTVDAPAGPVSGRVSLRPRESSHAGKGRAVESVALELESAFVFAQHRLISVPGYGTITVDVAYAGGFGLLIPCDEVDLAIVPANAAALARCGMSAIEAANDQIAVCHPTRPYITTVDSAEFYDPVYDALGRGKNAMVYGEAHVDRSACGTGTSVKMALLHRRGQLEVGETYVNESILGTTFEGRVVAETMVGETPAIVPEVRGRAQITGLHHFVVDPCDPFPRGFLI